MSNLDVLIRHRTKWLERALKSITEKMSTAEQLDDLNNEMEQAYLAVEWGKLPDAIADDLSNNILLKTIIFLHVVKQLDPIQHELLREKLEERYDRNLKQEDDSP